MIPFFYSMINKNEKEIIIFLRKNTEEKKVTKSNHVIRELLVIIAREAKEQILGTKPKDAKVWITRSALDFMGRDGISTDKVKETILYGNYVPGKKDRIYKKYNGYVIETITQYDKRTKTYTVLAAWKKNK